MVPEFINTPATSAPVDAVVLVFLPISVISPAAFNINVLPAAGMIEIPAAPPGVIPVFVPLTVTKPLISTLPLPVNFTPLSALPLRPSAFITRLIFPVKPPACVPPNILAFTLMPLCAFKVKVAS